MYDANRVLRRLCLYIVRYNYDLFIYLIMLLKCVTAYDCSLT